MKHKFLHSLRQSCKLLAVGRSSTSKVTQTFSKDSKLSNWQKNIRVNLVMIPLSPRQISYSDFMLWGIEDLYKLTLEYFHCIEITQLHNMNNI